LISTSLQRFITVGALALGVLSGGANSVAQDLATTEVPTQVEVWVKIIEFQASKGVETGLSTYFAKLPRARPFGRVELSGNAIDNADLTFPTNLGSSITVFLDRLRIGEGDFEFVLQALVDENRAFILSQPRIVVPINRNPDEEALGSQVKTTQNIPYENTQVVGNTPIQITSFKETGVSLTIKALDLIDDDGDPNTRDDIYIRLNLQVAVTEEGQRIVVALDDLRSDEGDARISVPEFVTRTLKTEVWVRPEQTLILGGLYRNQESNSLSTLPWVAQGEDLAIGLAERFIPGNFLFSPVSSTIGNRASNKNRRELVFILKARIWEPRFSLMDTFSFEDDSETRGSKSPSDMITEVLEGLAELPQGLAGSDDEDDSIDANLGGIRP
jgi:Flp pilus assembly secretin CpaC